VDSFSTDDEHQLSVTTTSNVDCSPPPSSGATAVEFQTVPEGPVLRRSSPPSTESLRPDDLQAIIDVDETVCGVALEDDGQNGHEFEAERPLIGHNGVVAECLADVNHCQQIGHHIDDVEAVGSSFDRTRRLEDRPKCGSHSGQPQTSGPLFGHSVSECLAQGLLGQTFGHIDESVAMRPPSVVVARCLEDRQESSSHSDVPVARRSVTGHKMAECLAEVLPGQTFGQLVEAEATMPSIGHSEADRCLDLDSVSTDEASPSSSRSRDRTSSSCSAGEQQVPDDVIVVMETAAGVNNGDLVGSFFTPSIVDSFTVDTASPPAQPPPRERDPGETDRLHQVSIDVGQK